MTAWVRGFSGHVTTRLCPEARSTNQRHKPSKSAARRSLARALVGSLVVHVGIAYGVSCAVAGISARPKAETSDSIGIELHRVEAPVDSDEWDTVTEATKVQRPKMGSSVRASANEQTEDESDGLTETGRRERQSQQEREGNASQQHLDEQPAPTEGNVAGRAGPVAVAASIHPAESPDPSSKATPTGLDGKAASARALPGAGPRTREAGVGASPRGAPAEGVPPTRAHGGSNRSVVHSLRAGSAASERIREAIQRGVVYPRLGRRLGWQGKVVVGFDVTPDGGVQGARVVRSSGHPVLDSSALAAVARAAPLPDVGKWLRLEIPIVFVLR